MNVTKVYTFMYIFMHLTFVNKQIYILYLVKANPVFFLLSFRVNQF